MIYSTPSGVQVHVLKKYLKRREFFPVDWRMTYALNVLDCIQNLASGKKVSCEGYELQKDNIVGWLKEDIPSSFRPHFVVAPPSRRKVAGDLARSLSELYGCTDLSAFFMKQNPLLRAAEQGISVEKLVENLECSCDLGYIQDGDYILIVDDVLSTGLSIDSVKAKISCVSNAQGLSFMGAAILEV